MQFHQIVMKSLRAGSKCARANLIIKRNSHSEYIIKKEENGVREIILNHQKTKNSLSLAMMNCLIDAINKDKDDPCLRAIVLSAKGNVFSAGHDMKELRSSTGEDKHKLIFKKATELMMSIVKSPVPVIAKIDGIAAAAGCQLVATCDIIVCTDTSKFSTPGANFGIFCSTPGIALARSLPKSLALFMLFTGEFISATEACQSGLVTTVVKKDELDKEVEYVLDKIKMKSRSVIALGKDFYYKQIEYGLSKAYKLGEDVMVHNINSCNGQEGIKSFIEKRKANWIHDKI